MKKILRKTKEIVTSEKLKNIILDISIVALVAVSIMLVFVQSENIWAKMIALGYTISTMLITLFLRIPSMTTEMGFKTTSIWSFLTWNVLYAVVLGIISGCLISKIWGCNIVKSGIASVTVVTIIMAILWFAYQLKLKMDNTAELDCYSSIMIATLTLLSLALDYSEVKISFLIMFLMYLVIQIVIKMKICRLKGEK